MNVFNRKLSRLPDDTLFDLENRLREPLFMGVPIGLTLTSHLNTQMPANPLAALRDIVGWVKLFVVGLRSDGTEPAFDAGRILLTWLADTPRLNELVEPVLRELGPGSCNVLGGERNVRARVPELAGFCSKYQICGGIARSAWRREYRRCCGTWHRQLRAWLRAYGLSGWLFPHLAYALAVRSLYVYGFMCFLERVRPTAILTDSEHNHPWACLILAARRKGIPTLQMIHCAIYTSYIFYPLLSDVALCWGEQQREQMTSFGVEPERLVVTGCQRLKRGVTVDGSLVRRRLRIPSAQAVVMLATNPIPEDQWSRQVSTFGDALEGATEIAGVVRLHPVERLSDHQDAIKRYPWIQFFESHQWTLEESVAASDVVVSHNSGVGNDALVMGKPVAILDVLQMPMTNGQVLADRAGCPVVRSAQELRRVVQRVRTEPGYREGLLVNAERYVSWFCCAFELEAARNVAREVRKRVAG